MSYDDIDTPTKEEVKEMIQNTDTGKWLQGILDGEDSDARDGLLLQLEQIELRKRL